MTQAVGPAGYFDVPTRGGQFALTPVRIQHGDAVRAKLAELHLNEADIGDVVTWARASSSAPGRQQALIPQRAARRAVQ